MKGPSGGFISRIPPPLVYIVLFSLMMALMSLKFSIHDILAALEYLNVWFSNNVLSSGSQSFSPLSDETIFAPARFRPVDRFDLSNVKSTWIIFSVLVVIVSFVLAF